MKGAKFSKIGLCSLAAYASLGDFLRETFKCSNQKLKYFYSKTELSRGVERGYEYSLPLDLVNSGKVAPVFESSRRPKIITENESFLILSKPYGLHGHPQSYSETDTVLNFLREARSDISWDDFKESEKGLLYRLDQGTSGLLIFVKDPKTHVILRDNFSKSVSEKFYYALVSGHLKFKGLVETPLVASGARGAKVKVDAKGASATLEVVDSHYFESKDVTLVKIKLETGLRHQIRVQMQSLGHPLVGDELYQGVAAPRLFLHCYSYVVGSEMFIDPRFDLLGEYLGLDSGLEMFGDKLLIS